MCITQFEWQIQVFQESTWHAIQVISGMTDTHKTRNSNDGKSNTVYEWL